MPIDYIFIIVCSVCILYFGYHFRLGLTPKDTIVIVPDVTNEEENILLRVVCIGEYVSPDGKVIKQAGAYRDFWLTPVRKVISMDEESL